MRDAAETIRYFTDGTIRRQWGPHLRINPINNIMIVKRSLTALIFCFVSSLAINNLLYIHMSVACGINYLFENSSNRTKFFFILRLITNFYFIPLIY